MKEWEIFNIKFKNLEPKPGAFLVSEPFLQDPYFGRTVILLTEHNDKGSVGFIVNKPINMQLNEAVSGLPSMDTNINFGGPVGKESLHFLHTLGNKIEGSHEVLKGLYWGGDFTTLKVLMEAGQVSPSQLRFFVGYAGWSPGQLVDELEVNSWLVLQGTKRQVMQKDSDKLWKEIVKSLGGDLSKIADFPADPSLN